MKEREIFQAAIELAWFESTCAAAIRTKTPVKSSLDDVPWAWFSNCQCLQSLRYPSGLAANVRAPQGGLAQNVHPSRSCAPA